MSRRRIYSVFDSCAAPGCKNGIVSGGLCMGHYSQRHRGKPFTRVKADADVCRVIDMARVNAEVSGGLRCRCGLLKPCGNCVPTIDHFAASGGEGD